MIIDIFLSHRHDMAVFDLSQGGWRQAQKEFVLFVSGVAGRGGDGSRAMRWWWGRGRVGQARQAATLYKKKGRGNIPRPLTDLG